MRNVIVGVRVAGMLPRTLLLALMLTPLAASARCERELEACRLCTEVCSRRPSCQPAVCMNVCEKAERCLRGEEVRLHRCTAEDGAPWFPCQCYDREMGDVPPGAQYVAVREGDREVLYKREAWRTREIINGSDEPGPLLPRQAPFPGEPIPPLRHGEPSWGFIIWRLA